MRYIIGVYVAFYALVALRVFVWRPKCARVYCSGYYRISKDANFICDKCGHKGGDLP